MLLYNVLERVCCGRCQKLLFIILYRGSSVTMEIIYFAANVLCNPQIAQVSPYTTTTLWFPAKKSNNTPPPAWFICFFSFGCNIVISIIIICLHIFVLLKQKECWQPDYSRSCYHPVSCLQLFSLLRLVKSALFPWVDGWILTDVVLRLPGELGAFERIFKSVLRSPKLDISQRFCCLWNVLVPSRQSRWLGKIHNYSGKGVEQRESMWSILTRLYFCSFFNFFFFFFNLSELLWSHFNLRETTGWGA